MFLLLFLLIKSTYHGKCNKISCVVEEDVLGDIMSQILRTIQTVHSPSKNERLM